MYVILHFTWPCTERLLLRLTKFLQISICKKEKEKKKLHNRLQYHFRKFNYKFLLEIAILKPLVTSLRIFSYTCFKMVI